jgi:hypothetical protein
VEKYRPQICGIEKNSDPLQSSHSGQWFRFLGILFFLSLLSSPAFAAQLQLSWADNSTNENGFIVERKIGQAGTYVLLVTLPPNTTSYVDTSAQDGVTYCYHVKAFNASGDSGYTNEQCAAPSASLAATTADPAASTSTDSGGGGGGGCFIATAAFGSPLAPEVQRLREVRDRYLLPYGPGRVLVQGYYAVSPPIADVIRQSEPLRAVVRFILLPILGWATLALWSPALGVGIALLPLGVGLWLGGRRSRQG